MDTSTDILNKIISQHTARYKDWQAIPLWISVEKNERQVTRSVLLPEVSQVGTQSYLEVSHGMILNNDILILTSPEIDIPISATLVLESYDNLFIITRAEYSIINYHKYQVFSNYLKIVLRDYGTYVPFQLEFLKITPIL